MVEYRSRIQNDVIFNQCKLLCIVAFLQKCILAQQNFVLQISVTFFMKRRMTHSHSFSHSDADQFQELSMITPAFELSQDSDFLTLVVRVPYTRTSEFDVYVDGEDFKFYAKPYFLR